MCVRGYEQNYEKAIDSRSFPLLGPRAKVEGSAKAFSLICHNVSAQNRTIEKDNKQAYEGACDTVWRSLYLLGTDQRAGPQQVEQASMLPSVPFATLPWTIGLHATHKLWVSGGCSFCASCSFVESLDQLGWLRHRNLKITMVRQ